MDKILATLFEEADVEKHKANVEVVKGGVRDEEAMPVGDKDVDPAWVSKKWICPHVVGGLPTSVVEKVFKMTRDGKFFTGIEGLV